MRARGRSPSSLARPARREQHGRGAVGDLRRRARGVHAVFARDRLQRRQLLERRLAQAFVVVDAVRGAGGLALVVEIGRVDRDDLALEPALAPRARGPHLRLEAEVVAVGAGDAPLVGDAFGRLELGDVLVLVEVRLRERAAGTVAAPRRRAGCGSSTRRRTPSRRRRRPTATSAAARLVACCDEPHWASTVVPAVAIGEAGGQPRGAGDVEGLLAGLGDAAADRLADQRGVDPGCGRSWSSARWRGGRRGASSPDRRCGGRAGTGRLRR